MSNPAETARRAAATQSACTRRMADFSIALGTTKAEMPSPATCDRATAEPGLVRRLVEAIAQRLRANPDRLEQNVVPRITRHARLLPRLTPWTTEYCTSESNAGLTDGRSQCQAATPCTALERSTLR